MVIAGIDEAGYGPLLGPMVVGASAFRITCEGEGPPNLWRALKGSVCAKRDARGRRVHIADSKVVYSPAAGIAGLELGVLLFAQAMAMEWRCLDTFVAAVDPGAADWVARHAWYGRREGEAYPIAIALASLGPRLNGLRLACAAARVEPLGMWARVMTEARYNDLVGRTRNKASALFSLAAGLLDHLMRAHAHEPGGVHIVCDRQGGREHYAEPLRTMFPDWRLAVERESPHWASYTLTRGSAVARIDFREKGETASLPTALASMLCKYVREALMTRFNAWWLDQSPGVEPTAGYHPDGVRFLADIATARTRLGVPDDLLIRCR